MISSANEGAEGRVLVDLADLERSIMRLSTLLTVFFLALSWGVQAQSGGATQQRAVLVTGASTGIGRKVTEKLAADGWFVYATARKESDLKALGALHNVQAISLDVTHPEEIAAAAETVKQGGRGLYALVNNAGVATAGTVADMSMDEFDLVMKVNVYGPVRMIKTFEPLILAAKGRIVNIGSISGIGASPNLTAYAMSKHAIEALTDVLAAELADTGVHVIVVEPGNYDSQIGKNAVMRVGANSPVLSSPGYKLQADRSKYKEPDEVAVAVEAALSEPKPKRRYMVVPNQHEADWALSSQIHQLVQLNEGQPYTYDQAGLDKMLSDALVGTLPRIK
jgi:NAD(P)-dependent dehydrogenase (short-subunit alcohol dehydrogenase family)